jgi:hypothetical protein
MLVYDDILRYQRGVEYTHGLTAEKVDAFNYNQFEGNILWFMDELVGMESDWIKTAAASVTSGDKTLTAYGYVQFTEDSVETAVNRYIGHLERFNERSPTRDWEPYSIKRNETLPIPEWLTTLKNSTKTHKEKLDALTYDEMLALAFVHLHSKKSKDSNFVLLAEGNIYASKEIYKNNHHTNPDAATLTRLEGFFPWRKQNKYTEKLAHATSGTPFETWIYKSCTDDANQTKTADDVINCIKQKLILHSGEDLKKAFEDKNATYITDVTSQIDSANLGVYTKFNENLENISGPGGAAGQGSYVYKVFIRYSGRKYGYYFYREGDHTTEWLQNIKTELTDNAHHYNYDELCQTIKSWTRKTHTYILDWWYDAPNANYFSNFTAPFTDDLEAGFAWRGVTKDDRILVLRLSGRTGRQQLITMFHEGGGHSVHEGEWGGKHGDTSGDIELLDTQQNIDLLALYKNYNLTSNFQGGTYASLFPPTPPGQPAAVTYLNSLAKIAWLDKYFLYYPMVSIINLGGGAYTVDAVEDEFLARVYSIMATNKCITFTDDIWPVMKETSPILTPLSNIINRDMAREIDIIMKDKMMLNKRTYRETHHS